MNILLTNDDGIHAPGILAAKRALETLGNVFVIAPERQRSAAGHAVTLHKPLRITPTPLPDGTRGWAVSGTPTDCVTLGHEIVMERTCDLVVSGINNGANLGWDLTYSGTVAAAFEGAILNLPSIAISVTSEGVPAEEVHFAPASQFLARLVPQLLADPLPPHCFLNVNLPDLPAAKLAGVEFTHQGRREYVDKIVTRQDPRGRPYYWQAGSLKEEIPDLGADVHAILENRISVTPIQLDLTDYLTLKRIRGWSL